ncbi:MAG: winged helix-turn-helix domain-containing protein [Candidatus Acidiferrales bacterium]
MKTFQSFRLDPTNHCLWNGEERVRIPPKACDVLRYLVENPQRLVTPDELLEALWPDTYVNPEVLRKYILDVRKILGDRSDRPEFIETLPKRGYRFVAAVSDLGTAEPLSASAAAVPAAPASLAGEASAVPAVPPKAHTARRPTFASVAAVLMALALVLGAWVYFSRRALGLTEKDSVVLADFANSTDDPIFDDTLKTALNISLRQSPFLNVLPDSEVATTLELMTRPAGTKLTPEVARELCQRAGSKAYIAGAIGSLGNEYVVGLKAVNCRSGDTLAAEQVTAASKEKVLDTLGAAATKLRSELGESLATVQKLDVPLEQATTSSLEALQAFSLGRNARNEKGSAPALPYFQRAIQLDPNFALAYWALGSDYFDLGELMRASEYTTKAFQLREHASKRERLNIAAEYYREVTGELDKAVATYREVIESYPRDFRAYGNWGLACSEQGKYEKAAEVTRQALRLAPDRLASYADLANFAIALQRLDEARQSIHGAQSRKLDTFVLHNALYALAFFGEDSAAMVEEQKWFAGKPEENFGLALASDTEAYGGHLQKARELTKRAVDSSIRADSKENGAIWQAIAAQREAAYGNATEARQSAAEALKMAPASQGVESEAALGFAMAGDTARAESLAQDLGKRFALDTQILSLWIPAIQGQLELNKKNPSAALNTLQAASAIELVKLISSLIFLASILCIGAEKRTWQRDKGVLPTRSFRRFSITTALSGIAGPERWRIWAWLVRTLYKRKPRRVPMPTPLASGRSQPTKTSSHCGKMPTPTFPS